MEETAETGCLWKELDAEAVSERERLAMVTELLLRLRSAEQAGKNTFTAAELRDALLDFAREMKQHK